MKTLFYILSFVLFFSLASNTYGHGGFEKSSGKTTVYITQDPTSPLVGEKVKFSFSLKDLSIDTKNLSDQNLVNIPVKLKLIDTYHGDESKDKVILTKNITTDVNGDFDFEYTFAKENYYDVELEYKDKEGNDQEIGFLVQPREKAKEQKENVFPVAILFLTAGALIGILLQKKLSTIF